MFTLCRFAAVDARGSIYVFHLRANRFSLAHAAGQEVTAIAFSPGRENDIIIALADHSIRILNSDSGATIATLKSHRQAVSSICPHPMGRFLVTCSIDACILWDLKSLKRMQNVSTRVLIGLLSGNRTGGTECFNCDTATLHCRPLRSFLCSPERSAPCIDQLRTHVSFIPVQIGASGRVGAIQTAFLHSGTRALRLLTHIVPPAQ